MTKGFATKEEEKKPYEEEEVYEADLEKYLEFVDFVTSNPSKDSDAFLGRLTELVDDGVDIQRLLTGAVGISAEGGEFMEIVKKIIFQGKPFNEDNRDHLIIELGDVMWYVAQCCMALNISIDEVVMKNVSKLLKRYPEGVFDVSRSEKRAANDR
ncbi:pyrophosphatase [Synechococcus phage S-H38]|uniref:Pyrophosphatase n=1 Tax=Synechococcus phage S-H38 TaxID=2783673 RepID=A0A873WJ56_9CAUD|nr:MazG-like pyrophosphatase [Synechococcus phage S-H38]QPB08045.1 pyrophosphatase [Synechococcus phage S-H38]